MILRRAWVLLCMGVWGASAASAAPMVMSDVPTTHSLVAMVMETVGEPALLLRSGASPHDYSLRPSEAAALRQSDVLFWTSASLTPWLPKARIAVAPGLTTIELAANPGTVLLRRRESANFLAPEQHDDAAAPDAPDAEGAADPHAWLDPVNAQHWLQLIADTLSALDPPHASVYQANALRNIESLDSLQMRIAEQLKSVQDKPFVVFHDSYQYFENRFELRAIASISLGDSTRPGIRQINALRSILARHPGACVFSEPQFSSRLVDTVTRGLDPRRGELDPLGAALPPGPGLYSQVLLNLADALYTCLSDSS